MSDLLSARPGHPTWLGKLLPCPIAIRLHLAELSSWSAASFSKYLPLRQSHQVTVRSFREEW